MNINLDSAKDTFCKNVLIYGYCKYENKGCAFSHTVKPTSSVPGSQGSNATTNSSGNTNADMKKKFNFNTPSFQPSSVPNLTNKFSNLSPNLKEIPVFVPSGGMSNADSGGINEPDMNDSVTPNKKFDASTPSFMPSNPYITNNEQISAPSPVMAQSVGTPGAKANGNIQHNPYLPGNAGTPQPTSAVAAPNSADVFFQQPTSSYPLQHHLYAPAPPPRLTIPLPPHEINVNLMFIPNDLRETLLKRNEATLQTLPRSNLPDHVNIYHSLVPIDTSFENISKVYELPSFVYKVFSNVDGNPYALRKIDIQSVLRITNELPFKYIKKWKSVKCANIVQLQEAFTSMAFGGSYSSLIVTYDYFPNSNTLQEQHINRRLGGKLEPITEELLWTYVIEVTNALINIHENDLAARSALDLSKILVTNKNRVRLGGVGVSDILNYEEDEEQIQQKGLEAFRHELQQADIKKFGKLILDLAALCLPNNARNHEPKDLINLLKTSTTVSFSCEFINLLTDLNMNTSDLQEFNRNHLSRRILNFCGNAQDLQDFMESQLSTELENARVFRLITKLNFIIDRPEYENDPNWQENGNKYIIKLFRDYIFFQYDEFGKPVCDLSRVLTNLNKLDAGIDEKFLLVNKDEKNCIIVSYKEIRDIIDSAFRTLTRG